MINLTKEQRKEILEAIKRRDIDSLEAIAKKINDLLDNGEQEINFDITSPPCFGFKMLESEIKNNNIENVKLLIEIGANVNEEAEDGYIINTAIYTRNVGMLNILLEAGAKVNVLNKFKENILFSASEPICVLDSELNHKTTEAMIKRLVEAGVDINAKNIYGKTAFSYFVPYYSLSLVKYLVEQGIDIDNINNGLNSLINATHHTIRDIEEKVILLAEAGGEYSMIDTPAKYDKEVQSAPLTVPKIKANLLHKFKLLNFAKSICKLEEINIQGLATQELSYIAEMSKNYLIKFGFYGRSIYSLKQYVDSISVKEIKYILEECLKVNDQALETIDAHMLYMDKKVHFPMPYSIAASDMSLENRQSNYNEMHIEKKTEYEKTLNFYSSNTYLKAPGTAFNEYMEIISIKQFVKYFMNESQVARDIFNFDLNLTLPIPLRQKFNSIKSEFAKNIKKMGYNIENYPGYIIVEDEFELDYLIGNDQHVSNANNNSTSAYGINLNETLETISFLENIIYTAENDPEEIYKDIQLLFENVFLGEAEDLSAIYE